jgi:hypothetical protein
VFAAFRRRQAVDSGQPTGQASSRRRGRWSAYLYIVPAFLIIFTFHILPAF